jgi:hypothetical protein
MIDVYVGEALVVACHGMHKGERSVDAAGGLGALLRSRRRRWRWPAEGVRYWLSSSLCRPFVMQPVAGLKSWKEAQALADGLAPAETALVADCEVRLEEWPGVCTVLALAVERITLDRLHSAAEAHGLVVGSIRPWWTRAVRAARHGTDSRELLWSEDTDGCIALGSRNGVYDLALAVTAADSAERAAVQARVRLAHEPFDGAMQRFCFDAETFDASSLGCVSVR